ncbi:unnamed protein product, partial [Urochloa humidicola]
MMAAGHAFQWRSPPLPFPSESRLSPSILASVQLHASIPIPFLFLVARVTWPSSPSNIGCGQLWVESGEQSCRGHAWSMGERLPTEYSTKCSHGCKTCLTTSAAARTLAAPAIRGLLPAESSSPSLLRCLVCDDKVDPRLEALHLKLGSRRQDLQERVNERGERAIGSSCYIPALLLPLSLLNFIQSSQCHGMRWCAMSCFFVFKSLHLAVLNGTDNACA